MGLNEVKVVDYELILPKRLLRIIKRKYPFHKIPKLYEYSQRIIDFSKQNNQLPFYLKFDINNDGKEEIILVQKLVIGGYGKAINNIGI